MVHIAETVGRRDADARTPFGFGPAAPLHAARRQLSPSFAHRSGSGRLAQWVSRTPIITIKDCAAQVLKQNKQDMVLKWAGQLYSIIF